MLDGRNERGNFYNPQTPLVNNRTGESPTDAGSCPQIRTESKVMTPSPERSQPTSAHTPTPWRVEEGTDLIWGACNPDDQSTYGMGYPVVEGKSASWKPYKPSMEERGANAALIVEAVNSHASLKAHIQELEEALRQARDRMLWIKDVRDGKTSGLPQVDAAISHIDALLSGAKP
jgi:hypothetical protein